MVVRKKIKIKKVSRKKGKTPVSKRTYQNKKIVSKKKIIKTKTTKRIIRKKRTIKKKTIRKTKTTKRRLVKRKLIRSKHGKIDLRRAQSNPIIGPTPNSFWESEAVFNPAAVVHGDRIHVFYRALGVDGVSRIGYASSKDGINFDRRFPYPVYMPETLSEMVAHYPYTSPARLVYDQGLYASGGGWGGCEDPRAVKIGDRIYLTFNMFNGWNSIQVGLTSIAEKDLEGGRFRWSPFVNLSPTNERHKNWTLFPEKIEGKYALFHNLSHPDLDRVRVEYLEHIDRPPVPFESPDPHLLPDRDVVWHNRTRSIGPPPVKTRYGWLVLYHAMDKNDPGRYKLGAMLLDSKDPTKVLYRSRYPLLAPDEWYENDWKPGIIYASGAVVKGGTLFIYYGGGDKYVGVAHISIQEFMDKLMRDEHIVLSVKSTKVVK
ncbi:MAG: Glycosidase PH1107-related protein [Parcubacteria bacterium C7867-005]|nr:MAG: Glycosidase PH1107-related protein [Parcubacteria bacterium C7867-005]